MAFFALPAMIRWMSHAVPSRLLWVDMCELAWVTVLSYYGQQKREKEGAAACALPGGGIFTEDILRGMSVSHH